MGDSERVANDTPEISRAEALKEVPPVVGNGLLVRALQDGDSILLAWQQTWDSPGKLTIYRSLDSFPQNLVQIRGSADSPRLDRTQWGDCIYSGLVTSGIFPDHGITPGHLHCYLFQLERPRNISDLIDYWLPWLRGSESWMDSYSVYSNPVPLSLHVPASPERQKVNALREETAVGKAINKHLKVTNEIGDQIDRLEKRLRKGSGSTKGDGPREIAEAIAEKLNHEDEGLQILQERIQDPETLKRAEAEYKDALARQRSPVRRRGTD